MHSTIFSGCLFDPFSNRLIFNFCVLVLAHFSELFYFALVKKFKLLTLPMSIIQFILFVMSKSTIVFYFTKFILREMIDYYFKIHHFHLDINIIATKKE